MPLYEYVCLKCGQNFETLVLSSDEQVVCPECESVELERVLSPFAVAAGQTSIGRGCGSGGFS
jgi:putative FmdB family regulatory protein